MVLLWGPKSLFELRGVDVCFHLELLVSRRRVAVWQFVYLFILTGAQLLQLSSRRDPVWYVVRHHHGELALLPRRVQLVWLHLLQAALLGDHDVRR